MTNEFLKAWDSYISDSDNQYTEDERIAFKNGWVYAIDYFLHTGQSLWNDATFPERDKTRWV